MDEFFGGFQIRGQTLSSYDDIVKMKIQLEQEYRQLYLSLGSGFEKKNTGLNSLNERRADVNKRLTETDINIKKYHELIGGYEEQNKALSKDMEESKAEIERFGKLVLELKEKLVAAEAELRTNNNKYQSTRVRFESNENQAKKYRESLVQQTNNLQVAEKDKNNLDAAEKEFLAKMSKDEHKLHSLKNLLNMLNSAAKIKQTETYLTEPIVHLPQPLPPPRDSISPPKESTETVISSKPVVEKPAETPVPVDKPVDKPKPVEKPVDKPKPVEKPAVAEKPVVVDKPVVAEKVEKKSSSSEKKEKKSSPNHHHSEKKRSIDIDESTVWKKSKKANDESGV